MSNSTAIDIGIAENDYRSKSLMQKWKDHFHRKSQNSTTKYIARGLFVFQAVSQYYMTLRYLIPYVFSYFTPWSIYYFKVLATYLAIMSVANWICVIFYDSAKSKSKDRPFPIYEGSRYIYQQQNGFSDSFNTQNGHCSQDTSEHLQSKFCHKCNLVTPPRAHHCDVCKCCILKRDHHCYLVGKCIGFRNQRYFVVLAFYSIIVCFWGLYITYVYLRDNWYPLAISSDMILPVTFYRCVFGDITAHVAILIFHCHMLACFGLIALIYFIAQFVIIIKGLTLYELLKKVPVRNTASVSQNLNSVFGDFWALNFIIPAQILFRQKENGCSWDSVKVVSHQKRKKPHCQIL